MLVHSARALRGGETTVFQEDGRHAQPVGRVRLNNIGHLGREATRFIAPPLRQTWDRREIASRNTRPEDVRTDAGRGAHLQRRGRLYDTAARMRAARR